MKMLDDDDDEVVYDDESVKYDEGEDKGDEVSRVVDGRSILLLATVSMTRLFTVDLVDGNKLELI